MNRRTAGLVTAAAGFALAAVGVAGALLAGAPAGMSPAITATEATATHTPAGTPTPAEEPAAEPGALSGSLTDPEGDLFRCGSDEPAPDGPAHLDLVRVTVREGTNPVTGEPSANLLLDVAAAASDPAVSFEARVPVEPGGGMPDGVQAVEWRLVYADGAFRRESSVLRGDTPEPGPIEDFRVRYEGLGDRVEIEFYGPPATRYHGATLIGDAICDVAVPG